MRKLLATGLLLGLAGCSIALLPGAEKVRFTRNPADIVGCQIIGRENADAADNYLKNMFFAKGGDTCLLATKIGRDGFLYNCSGVDQRQPVPVEVKEEK